MNPESAKGYSRALWETAQNWSTREKNLKSISIKVVDASGKKKKNSEKMLDFKPLFPIQMKELDRL